MTITVVGTVAFDAIQTPFGKVDRCLGGSATYFSVAASFFSRVNLEAVVSEDFTDLGVKTLVIKRGEYGVLMMTSRTLFAAPAYPLESVFDPTGAGDTFAGGFLGYLASRAEASDRDLRRAIIFGSTLASFTVEKFSLDRLREITIDDVYERYRAFRTLTHFEDFEV